MIWFELVIIYYSTAKNLLGIVEQKNSNKTKIVFCDENPKLLFKTEVINRMEKYFEPRI